MGRYHANLRAGSDLALLATKVQSPLCEALGPGRMTIGKKTS
jgi:hypothetical protein